MKALIDRELRVAFSRKAQPAWFRVAKYVVMLGLAWLACDRADFWLWVGGLLVAGVALHLFWRWKTQGWTRAWGGWNDMDTAGPRDSPAGRKPV